MNIYLVEQSENNGYDTYESFVCVSKSEKNARNIHPDWEIINKDFRDKKYYRDYESNIWCSSPKLCKVTLIGKADPSIKEEKFICKSFNAG